MDQDSLDVVLRLLELAKQREAVETQDLGRWHHILGLVLWIAILLALWRLIKERAEGRHKTGNPKSPTRQPVTEPNPAGPHPTQQEQSGPGSSEPGWLAPTPFTEVGGAPPKFREDWEGFVTRPVPPDIEQSMRGFLSGVFIGEDRSPLAYVGYQVGKTHGLPEWDRHRRLDVCFRIEIPDALPPKYASWGRPASVTRLTAMMEHLTMLASMRRKRRNFEVAVAEWEADAQWLRKEFMQTARKFSGFSWRESGGGQS